MIQAWCPHHGLYPIGPATARLYSSSLLAGAQCGKLNNDGGICNEEVFVLIDGKKIAHPDEITNYIKEHHGI